MGTAKLLYVATSDRFWGFLEGQASYARARGFEIHAASSPGPALEDFAARERAAAWPVPMTRGLTPLRDLAALRRLCRLVRELGPAVVHAHTPKAGLLGMVAARWGRVPVRVYTLHGLVWQTRRGWRRRLLVALERLACRLSTQVLAVSASVRQRAIEAGLSPPGKIAVPGPGGSANGLDFQRFDPAGVRAAPRCGPVVLGYAGRLTPDKGIAELSQAWQILRGRFPDLHLLVAGEPEPHDPLPAGVLAGLRCDPRVHWTGWVDNMPEEYLAMDICVLPSRREGLPYAAMEAAAMERPVAGFAVDGVRDAVEDGGTGLLAPPGSPAALAGAIARLVEDPALRARLGREARRRALALWAREPLWESICAHYRAAPRLGWKRPLDAAAATLLLVAFSPLLLLAALGVWVELGRPILFRQWRPGWGERLFPMLKFRTMRAGDAPDAARLGSWGRWLRRTSLDELPQLWNVLRGEMSLVGPRPLLERYLPYYTARERLRHRVRPGLTGWAQVHGRNEVGWRERLELDVWYVEHASLGLDMRILWRTLGWWFRGRGVREDPSAWMADLDQERQGA
jgi:lipopolysaccharide/colanic/teichoic acid biosynthesis glycosyltransferase